MPFVVNSNSEIMKFYNLSNYINYAYRLLPKNNENCTQ